MDDRQTRRRYLGLCAAGVGTALTGCAGIAPPGVGDEPGSDGLERIDDWQYDPTTGGDGGTIFSSGSGGGDGASGATEESIGLAAGGAKDVGAFRRNVREGKLPLPESLSYEGLFYDYYFETGGDGSCGDLFCPQYAPAVTPDPLSGETERYLTVGLDSGLSQSDFERKALNLVVVLDISGSMDAAFDEYYYDRHGNRQEVEGGSNRRKIAVARDALVALTQQLRQEDRLGVVLFDDSSAVAKPLRRVEATDMDAIREHIREDVQAGGGTNIEAGIDDATALLAEYEDADPSERENRTILLTDAMPNLGETSAGGLRGTLEANADRGLYTTAVGIGLDFNAELVDRITAIRGSNYYSVHSAEEFERRLGEEFEYMVTPLVFDLSLELDAEGYEIRKVYGSTAAEEATGEIMRVNTLFPSPARDGETRGGVVLVQVDRQSASPTMRLRARWETRDGRERRAEETITFPDGDSERFGNSGVRKAVLLSRYADLLKNWMAYEREAEAVEPGDGIGVPPEEYDGRWEQESVSLTVSERYANRIRTFREYFASETGAIGDDSLEQELDLLDEVLAAA